MPDYSIYTDEHLIELLHEQNSEADAITDFLLEKYKPLVRKQTNALYIIGAETDDLIQEGMIGLFKAIRDYKGDRDASFYTFASLCIKRHLYNALETSNRKKNQPLNSYLSIYANEEDGDGGLEELLKGESDTNPEQMILEREFWTEFCEKLKEGLSVLERQVLTLYLEGKPYTEIAVFLNKEPKAIDNALQRIRKKVAAMKE